MTVSIPHDWAVKGPFDKDIDKQVVAIEQNGERNATEKTGRTGSLPWIGEGWYRTEITIPEGFCSGDATSTEVFTNPTMKAFHGQLVIVLQSTAQSGVSTLTVKGKGLKGGKIDIKTI